MCSAEEHTTTQQFHTFICTFCFQKTRRIERFCQRAITLRPLGWPTPNSGARRGWIPSREWLRVSLGSLSFSISFSWRFSVLIKSLKHPGRAGLLRVIFCRDACGGFATVLYADDPSRQWDKDGRLRHSHHCCLVTAGAPSELQV